MDHLKILFLMVPAKKTSKKTLDHKTRHILGWIDLTRSFPTSRPQELKDRKKNHDNVSHAKFFPNSFSYGVLANIGSGAVPGRLGNNSGNAVGDNTWAYLFKEHSGIE